MGREVRSENDLRDEKAPRPCKGISAFPEDFQEHIRVVAQKILEQPDLLGPGRAFNGAAEEARSSLLASDSEHVHQVRGASRRLKPDCFEQYPLDLDGCFSKGDMDKLEEVSPTMILRMSAQLPRNRFDPTNVGHRPE
jgi:hypothetical protein